MGYSDIAIPQPYVLLPSMFWMHRQPSEAPKKAMSDGQTR